MLRGLQLAVVTASLSWLNTVNALPQDTAVQGLVELVQRRLPNNANDFDFILSNTSSSTLDQYTVSSGENGAISVEGNSLSALTMGLHRYLKEVAYVDMDWHVGSHLNLTPSPLPQVDEPLVGSSVVPYRYHLNTVTFSYTAAFWSWTEWENQLDWMALHGVNIALAWVGVEKLLVDLWRGIGLSDPEIFEFFTGPAFQSWNRFGNIQGDWTPNKPTGQPMDWINAQFELQKKIVQRMVDLGITPILPAFPGFVPRAFTKHYPHAVVQTSSVWNNFQEQYTSDGFLNPAQNIDLYNQLQKTFIQSQLNEYGNVTHFYTLDQYNENSPPYTAAADLRNLSHYTWQSLKQADSQAIWVMQAWLFLSQSSYWTSDRIEGYLGGVTENNDMLILDLHSESSPQWQRTNSYYGKPWIWCQLHNLGGAMTTYGQIENLTVSAVEALKSSSSLVGFGLTMEAQTGSEVVYDLLLDQAWSPRPLDTYTWFQDWARARYGPADVPPQLLDAWDRMRTTVFNNTNLHVASQVPKSFIEKVPSFSTPSQAIYDPAVMVKVWNLFNQAADSQPSLWSNEEFQFDMVDITRQVLANAFTTKYTAFVQNYQNTSNTELNVSQEGEMFLNLLSSYDAILSTQAPFRFSTWMDSALSYANTSAETTYFDYNARNQLTMWGPRGEINDYASKAWGGLVGWYYLPRWKLFFNYLSSTSRSAFKQEDFNSKALAFSKTWQTEAWNSSAENLISDLKSTLTSIQEQWADIFQ